MTRFGVLLLVGCGRVAFDARTDAAIDEMVGFDARLCTISDPNDEDGDRLGDSCDPCPHLAVGLDADSDGDMVGDACDPEPANPRQRIRFFDGFNSDLPEWNSSDQLVGGQRIIDVVNTDSNSVLNLAGTTYVVEIGGSINAVGATPVHIFFGSKVTAVEQYYVELIDTGGGRRSSLMHYDGAYSELDGLTEPGIPVPTGPFRIKLGIENSRMYGRVLVAGNDISLNELGTPAVDLLYSLMYVQNASVALDWVIWIDTI